MIAGFPRNPCRVMTPLNASRTGFVMGSNVVTQHVTEVPLTQDDHMIQKVLTPKGEHGLLRGL